MSEMDFLLRLEQIVGRLDRLIEEVQRTNKGLQEINDQLSSYDSSSFVKMVSDGLSSIERSINDGFSSVESSLSSIQGSINLLDL